MGRKRNSKKESQGQSVPFPQPSPLPPFHLFHPRALLFLSSASPKLREAGDTQRQQTYKNSRKCFRAPKHKLPTGWTPRAMTTSSEKPVPNSWNKKKPPGEFEVFLKRLMKTKWKYWQSPDIPEDRKPEFVPFYAPHIATMVFKNKWLQTETWQGKDRVFSKGRNNYCDGIIRSIFFSFIVFGS